MYIFPLGSKNVWTLFSRICQTNTCGSCQWNWGQSFPWLKELWEWTVSSLLCQKKCQYLNVWDCYNGGYVDLQYDTFCSCALAINIHLLLLVKFIRVLKLVRSGKKVVSASRKKPLERRMQCSVCSHPPMSLWHNSSTCLEPFGKCRAFPFLLTLIPVDKLQNPDARPDAILRASCK